MRYWLIIAVVALVISCKTVSRNEFSDTMSTIAIKMPDQFKDYDTRLSFSRIDSTAPPKIVRGPEIQVKLPKGEYKLELSILNKSGMDEYQLCEISKTARFDKDREEPILEICNRRDKIFVSKTLQTQIINPDPQPPQPIDVPPVVTDLPKTDTETEPETNGIPIFEPEPSCFGQNVVVSREGNEIVMRIGSGIKNYRIENGNYPRCRVKLNIKKLIKQGFAISKYTIRFESSDETLTKKLFLTSSAKDKNGVVHYPCKTALFTSAANSGLEYKCGYYDFVDEKVSFTERNKLAYKTSCEMEAQDITFEFLVAGTNGTNIPDLNISEIRLEIPRVENCITLSE